MIFAQFHFARSCFFFSHFPFYSFVEWESYKPWIQTIVKSFFQCSPINLLSLIRNFCKQRITSIYWLCYVSGEDVCVWPSNFFKESVAVQSVIKTTTEAIQKRANESVFTRINRHVWWIVFIFVHFHAVSQWKQFTFYSLPLKMQRTRTRMGQQKRCKTLARNPVCVAVSLVKRWSFMLVLHLTCIQSKRST